MQLNALFKLAFASAPDLKSCLLYTSPEGVTSSYIQCLDVIQKLQTRGIWPKISDLSDALNLPRPGVTRTCLLYTSRCV